MSRALLTDPAHLSDKQRELVDELTGRCSQMKALAGHAHDFAALLRPEAENAERLGQWITAVRAEDLPHLHSFTRGLDQDRAAVTTAFTLPFHNGRTEASTRKRS